MLPPVPTVFYWLPVPTVCAAFSAHSACCPPVLGFGFRAPARAPTFSEISSYSYKVTEFQKRLSKKDYIKEKFLLSTCLTSWWALSGSSRPRARPLGKYLIKQLNFQEFLSLHKAQHWNYLYYSRCCDHQCFWWSTFPELFFLIVRWLFINFITNMSIYWLKQLNRQYFYCSSAPWYPTSWSAASGLRPSASLQPLTGIIGLFSFQTTIS